MQIYDLLEKVIEQNSATMSIYHSKDFDEPAEVGCDALICGYNHKGATYLVKKFEPFDGVAADFVGIIQNNCLVFGYEIQTSWPF